MIKAMWDHWVKTMLCRFSVELFGLQCLPSVVNSKGDTRTYSSQIYFVKKHLFLPHQILLSNCSRSHYDYKSKVFKSLKILFIPYISLETSSPLSIFFITPTGCIFPFEQNSDTLRTFWGIYPAESHYGLPVFFTFIFL